MNFNKQFTKNQAIEYGESKEWETLSLQQLARIGLFQTKLCVPFDKLHEAVEKTMNRAVFTYEFGINFESLSVGVFGDMSRYDLF